MLTFAQQVSSVTGPLETEPESMLAQESHCPYKNNSCYLSRAEHLLAISSKSWNSFQVGIIVLISKMRKQTQGVK